MKLNEFGAMQFSVYESSRVMNNDIVVPRRGKDKLHLSTPTPDVFGAIDGLVMYYSNEYTKSESEVAKFL